MDTRLLVDVKYTDAVENVSDTYVETRGLGRNPSAVPLLLPLVFR